MELQIATLNRHEKLSTVNDFPNYSHRNEKYLIVSLSLNQCKCIISGMAWEAEQQLVSSPDR